MQSRPQEPQFRGSVRVSVQLVPQRLGVGAMQLDEHVGTPVIDEQSPVGATHRLVQLPQVAGKVKLVSQPSLGFDEQCPNPLTHADGCTTHAPATHWTAGATDPALTLGSSVQSKVEPHPPQFCGSRCVSTHLEPQRFGVEPAQLGTQVKGVVDVEHTDAVAGHAFAQLPHVRGSVRFASHPSSGCVEQWANPDTHALAGTEHTPDRHWIPVAPGLTLASVVQLWPQAPQLVTSELRSTHFDPQRSGEGEVQLDEHVGAPVVVEHNAVGAVQTLPHCPQLAGRVRSVSQPSSARVEQCAYPALQALGGT